MPENSIIADSTVVLDPVVDDELVVAAFYERRLGTFPFFRGGAMAVDARTGRVIWSRLLPQPYAPDVVSNGTFSAVASTSTTVAVWSQTGHIYGLNRVDGSLRWTVPPDPAIPLTYRRPSGDFRPVASDGSRILIGSGLGWITAVDGATGGQLWRTKSPYGGLGLNMWVDRGSLYAVHPAGQMSSYVAATGALRWGLNDGRAETTLGMAFDGERLYAGDIGGGVFSAAR